MSVYDRVNSEGAVPNYANQNDDDDWETDPDFVNDVTEEQQRWGSTIVQPKLGDATKMDEHLKGVEDAATRESHNAYKDGGVLYGQKTDGVGRS